MLVYFDRPHQVLTEERPLSRKALLEANENVRRLLQLLTLHPVTGVRNLHPAYCSLLVKFDALIWRHEEMEAKLRDYLAQLHEVRLLEPRLVEIPVSYGEEFGPDLQDVAAMHGLTSEQVIQLHGSVTYLVYFLGFVPGFAYLGELPEPLVTPRHPTPRRKVPVGSVGIAGNQTGVYPCETPGGWRLLGRTPLAMLRQDQDASAQEKSSLLSVGDHVRFKAISREQFAAMHFETGQFQTRPNA